MSKNNSFFIALESENTVRSQIISGVENKVKLISKSSIMYNSSFYCELVFLSSKQRFYKANTEENNTLNSQQWISLHSENTELNINSISQQLPAFGRSILFNYSDSIELTPIISSSLENNSFSIRLPYLRTIWDSSQWHTIIERRPLVGSMIFFTHPQKYWLIYMLEGSAEFEYSTLRALLQGDIAILHESNSERFLLKGAGQIVVVEITLCEASILNTLKLEEINDNLE